VGGFEVIYQFRSWPDDELFVLDIVNQKWGRASSILSAPSVSAAAEGAVARFVYSEEGALIPMGAGVFNMDGRTEKTTGAGAGLSTVGIMAVPFEQSLILYLRPNVNVKPDSFVSGFPEEMQKFIKYQIIQPNPEKLAAATQTQSK
jgi:hypothetical protein